MGDPNCYDNSYLNGCYACPNGNITSKKGGDLLSAIQKSNYPPVIGRAAGYNMGHLHNRVAYRNNVGVDRKHDSYQRYLARRVGGVFRKEKMPNIVGRTSWRGQPRTRTGSKACCKRPTHSKSGCPSTTITVGQIHTGGVATTYFGWTTDGLPYIGQSGTPCLSKLSTLSWDDNSADAPVTPRFVIQFGFSWTGSQFTSTRSNFISITIRDQNRNSITYTQDDAHFEPNSNNAPYGAGYTWSTPMPSWIMQGTVIEVFLAGAPQCCENRIPNCSEQSKFTGMGKTRDANGELVGPGNVKNRTCVAQRCQCPNCP